MKQHPSDAIESITITIDKHKHPTLFANKVACLIDSGLTKEQAEKETQGMEIELELYYEVGLGLFGVESEALDNDAWAGDNRFATKEQAQNSINNFYLSGRRYEDPYGAFVVAERACKLY